MKNAVMVALEYSKDDFVLIGELDIDVDPEMISITMPIRQDVLAGMLIIDAVPVFCQKYNCKCFYMRYLETGNRCIIVESVADLYFYFDGLINPWIKKGAKDDYGSLLDILCDNIPRRLPFFNKLKPFSQSQNMDRHGAYTRNDVKKILSPL